MWSSISVVFSQALSPRWQIPEKLKTHFYLTFANIWLDVSCDKKWCLILSRMTEKQLYVTKMYTINYNAHNLSCDLVILKMKRQLPLKFVKFIQSYVSETLIKTPYLVYLFLVMCVCIGVMCMAAFRSWFDWRWSYTHCSLLDMGAGNWTLALWKSSNRS